MYFNLKYIVSEYISSNNHYYLRCISDEWRKASQLTKNIDEFEYININNINNFRNICEQGYQELVLYAIDKGAKYWFWGLCGACKGGNLKIVQLMIEKGANSWNSGLIGATYPPGCGIWYNYFNLEKIAIMNKSDGCWNWGLNCACQGGHLEIVKLMIEKGANDWNIGLCCACFGGHLEIVKLMIEKGANNIQGCINNFYTKPHIKKYLEQI